MELVSGTPIGGIRRPRWAKRVCGCAVHAGAGCQARDSDEVVGGGDQMGVHLHPLTPAVAGLAQAADRLHPAKRLLHPFADPLADGVTRMTHGASVERRAARADLVSRHLRSDCERAAVGDEVAGVITLVGAQRDPAAAGQALIRHGDGGAPLGVAVGRLDLKVD